MLENSLVELMQNIWCDWMMNVTEWKSCPKWPIDTASNIMRHAVWMKFSRAANSFLLGLLYNSFSPRLISIFCWFRVLKILGRGLAFNTCAIFCAGNEALLWVVSNITSKNGMDMSNSTIWTGHLNSIGACFNKRLQDNTHWLMEQPLNKRMVLLVIHSGTVHLLHRKICYENTCMFWRFALSGFRNIPDGKIDRICSFISRKLSKLSFVSCDNNWGQSSTLWKMRLGVCQWKKYHASG